MEIHPAWHSMAPAKLRRDRRTASQWYVSWVAADISGWSAQFILVPVWDFDILDIQKNKNMTNTSTYFQTYFHWKLSVDSTASVGTEATDAFIRPALPKINQISISSSTSTASMVLIAGCTYSWRLGLKSEVYLISGDFSWGTCSKIMINHDKITALDQWIWLNW